MRFKNSGIKIKEDAVRVTTSSDMFGVKQVEIETWNGAKVVITDDEDIETYFTVKPSKEKRDVEKVPWEKSEKYEMDSCMLSHMLWHLVEVTEKAAVTDSISERDTLLEEQRQVLHSVANRDWEK